jgi:hypothetical protein
MSNRKGKMFIGVSYAAPFYYLVGVYRTCLFKPVLLQQSKTLCINDYPKAIWVASLPFGLFEFEEDLKPITFPQSIAKYQYLGLKNGVSHWQTCQIKRSIYQEYTAFWGKDLARIQIFELDLHALWEYALAKTQYPFHTRLLLWHKSPYVIGLHGREGELWRVYYWSETITFDLIKLKPLLDCSLPQVQKISCFLKNEVNSDLEIEYLFNEEEFDYILAIALAYRGFKHGL